MNFSQLAFGLFALKIYGILISGAFVIATWHYYRTVKKEKLTLIFFLHNFWKWLLGALVMGRIFALLLDFEIVQRGGGISFFAFWDGGIHFLGVILGFLASLWWYCRRAKESFWKWVDTGIVSFLLGILMVDIAGFLTGAIYGRETIMPWGVQYQTFGVDILTPVHPVTLYAFFLHFLLLVWVRKRGIRLLNLPGQLTVQTGILFFLSDIILQSFRGDSIFLFWEIIRIEQVFDVLIIGGLFSYNVLKKRVEKF